nr:ATP-binding cassette domain-containing protein [Gammaproteobacteria bacterium]NIN62131.1 ATP-binding cassette domain-containing protein [Gammaproteobacteria bacterium]NIO63625.1 ATP-binding cassette domain-containing protein [Gammaproteobacteria bacterium]NIQ19603.1 ATP-binding cassette domain-containing protein [Gammaproteobacteria bacterium]NIT05960.1 ATP-binding cassette domain-containing protein [Gammaproteobacteria bacterium]
MINYILRIDHLTKDFGSGNARVRAVDDVSLMVSQGELVLIMGPSGSGKTTLLSMCGGLLRPTTGNIFLEQVQITGLDEKQLPTIRAQKVGFIFQAFNLLDALTVEENILLPASLVKGNGIHARDRARELISNLGLEPRIHAKPQTLSGGEKQRVAIA